MTVLLTCVAGVAISWGLALAVVLIVEAASSAHHTLPGQAHPRRRLSSRDRWTVRVVPYERDVGVYVVRTGAPDRLIGRADPLIDMDAFMELRVKADQAAETLNALKIGAA
jgi:hypothetical protein